MAEAWTDREVAVNYRRSHPGIPPFVTAAILKYDQQFFHDRPRIPFAVDVGCGSGQLTIPLLSICEKVMGTDISPAQIEEAEVARQELPEDERERLEFRVESAYKLLDLTEAMPDLITGYSVLHHFDKDKFIYEACSALKPGGMLAIFKWEIDGFRDVDKRASDLYFSFIDKMITNSPKNMKKEDAKRMYRELEMPLDDLTHDETKTELEISRDNFELFLRQFSFFIRYRRENKEAAEEEMKKFLEQFWKLAGEERTHLVMDMTMISVFGRKIIF